MSIAKLLTAVMLAIFTTSALQGERHCPGNVPSVPLRLVQGSVNVVGVVVNGAGPFDFLVDTGAQTTTVDEELAAQLHLGREGSTHVSGAATYVSRAYTHIERVEVGGRSVSDVVAVIDNLAELHGADRKIRGIIGENFLTHFDLLIDNQHQALCLDDTGAIAAAMKETRLPLAKPHGTDADLPFMRPLVIEARPEGTSDDLVFRLDSGSNVPLLYGKSSLRLAQANAVKILKRFVNGVEHDFAVLPPRNVSIGRDTFRQVTFVQTMNSIGAVQQPRDDGLLPTQIFQRVFISYTDEFVILEPR